MRVIATTFDPDGRRVSLTENAWAHIKSEHSDTAPYLREIMAAGREPDRRFAGRTRGEEWYFAEAAGPGPWLRAVVHSRETKDGW